jgi:hypothetical protein
MAPHSNAAGLAVPGITSALSRNGFGSQVILPADQARSSHRIGHLRPSSTTRRLVSSGKGNPCPVCGRTKDGDCRWGDDWIACHSGAAANHLKPGQTIEADGQTWYLSRTGGGHSGMAHVYRLHRPGQLQRHHCSKGNIDNQAMVATCRRLYALLRPRVHAALRLPIWERCSLLEMRLVSDTYTSIQQLIHRLQRARRSDPSLARLLPITRHWLKAMGYQLADLRHFQRQQLGMGEGWR